MATAEGKLGFKDLKEAPGSQMELSKEGKGEMKQNTKKAKGRPSNAECVMSSAIHTETTQLGSP